MNNYEFWIHGDILLLERARENGIGDDINEILPGGIPRYGPRNR